MKGRRWSLALGLLLGKVAGAQEPSPGQDAPLVLTADRVELVAGQLSGEGHVVAVLDGERIEAARFRLDPQMGLLEVWEGTWTRPQGVARFEGATVDLEGREGEIRAARVAGAGGDLVLEGETLTWREDGALEGRGLRVTTCGCAHPVWEVQARHAVVRPGQDLRFEGGLVRILGVPLLPVPAGRLALADRRSGLLPPRVSTGRDGFVLGLPAWLALGPTADLQLEPELRTGRGIRLMSQGRVALPAQGKADLRLALGQDWERDAFRGAASADLGYHQGPWRLGLDAQAESDRAYLADHADAFLARSWPWSETLAMAAWGPLRVEHDGFQSLGEATVMGQRPLGLVLHHDGQRLGPLSLDGGARVDVLGQGTDPWELQADPQGRVQADLDLALGRGLGPLRAEAEAGVDLLSWTDGRPWAVPATESRLWLPTWAELGRARLVGEWGLRAGASTELGEADRRLPWELPTTPWRLGPMLSGRLLTSEGVPLSATGALSWTEAGLWPEVWLRANRGPWTLRGAADPDQQEGRVIFDDSTLRLGGGLVVFEEILQTHLEGAWTLPGPLSEWRPGYQALLDLAGERALSHGPRLSFTSRCGCLSFSAAATWSVDREVPDFGFQMDLQ